MAFKNSDVLNILVFAEGPALRKISASVLAGNVHILKGFCAPDPFKRWVLCRYFRENSSRKNFFNVTEEQICFQRIKFEDRVYVL